MKLHVLVIVAMLTVSVAGSVALAESSEGWEHGKRGMQGSREGGFGDPARMVEKMSQHLALDDVQRQSVQNILDAAKPEMDAMRERKQAVRENKQALESADDASRSALVSQIAVEEGQLVTEGCLLRDRVHTDISAVLNEEQRAKLAEFRDHRGKRGGDHKSRHRPEYDQDRDSAAVEQL